MLSWSPDIEGEPGAATVVMPHRDCRKSEFIVSQLMKHIVLYTICCQDPMMLIGLSNELKTLSYICEK